MAEQDEFDTAPPGADAGRLGDRLRAMREARGMSVRDMATETRIPLRHLENLENSDFTALPGKTYAVGFVKAYARAVDADEVELAEAVRREYDYVDTGERTEYQAFNPADPSRVPSRSLAWTAAAVGVLLLALYGIWRLGYFGGATVDPYAEAVIAQAERAQPGLSNGVGPAAAPAGPVAATAPVVLAANDAVWLRVDDAAGTRVYEAEMKAGERYAVPAGRAGLIMRTARPQALDIIVGGRKLATLGPPDTLVSNVPLDPPALVARADKGP